MITYKLKMPNIWWLNHGNVDNSKNHIGLKSSHKDDINNCLKPPTIWFNGPDTLYKKVMVLIFLYKSECKAELPVAMNALC